MGNYIVFGDRTKYVYLEAGVGGGFLSLTIIGIVVLFAIYCCRCWIKENCMKNSCCCACCKKQEDEDTSNQSSAKKKSCHDRTKTCCACCKKQEDEDTSNQSSAKKKTCCACCKKQEDEDTSNQSCCQRISAFLSSVKYLHRFLGYIFSSVSELYIKSETHTEAGNTKTTHTEAGNTKTTPVLIVSERKIPSGCTECLTYLYFIYMSLMCGLWFIAIAIEYSIYRKTTTCNDIDFNVHSFRCFDLDNHYNIVDCINADNSIRVICYLYRPTVSTIGVAFSAAKLISIIGDVTFNIILKGTNQCSACCFCVLRILGIFFAIVLFVIFMWLTQTRIWDHDYFTYAGIPMRVTQLILLCMTVFGMLVLPPWTKYSNEEYNTKYRHLGHMYDDVERDKKPQCPQDPPGQGYLPRHPAPHQEVVPMVSLTVHSEHVGEERRLETSNV